MRVIRPLRTLCNDILDYNVVQDHPVWDVATTYHKGDLVIIDSCGSTVYESLVNSNLGNSPSESPLEWLPIGTSNYFAMFDEKNGTQTTNPESIEVVIGFDSLVNAVGLVNVECTEARFQVWADGLDYTVDTPTIDYTVNMRDIGVSDWYEYVTYNITQVKNFVNFEINTFVGGTGKLTLSYPSGTAKLGSLVYGNKYEIGKTVHGLTAGIKDYSTKETDIFGDYTVIEREFKDTIRTSVIVDNGKTRQVKDILAQYRSMPLLWQGADNYEVSATYGYYLSFNITLESPAWSRLDLEIQGL
jgi:hypothetical protein